MIECTRPELLIKLANKLETNGANGFLLSGGCDTEGRVPLDRFYPVIKEIKSSTALRVNLHVGLIRPEEIQEVAESGVDTASVEVIGDDDTIREVYNLKANKERYETMLTSLHDKGANVVPHITVGLHFGELRGEESALEMIEKIKPKAIVLNSLLPTKETAMENARSNSADYISVLASARKRFPNSNIMMGCMRPRIARVEREALRIGIDGIVLPSRKIIEEFRHENIELCCAVTV